MSNGGGRGPVWSRDGRDRLYVSQREVVVARLTVEPTFAVGARTPLFDVGPYVTNLGRVIYSADADGSRLMMIRPGAGADAESRPRLVMVQSRLRDLERMMGN